MKTKSLDFLDKEPLIKQVLETNDDKIEKNNGVETVLEFMDELFTNIFMKDYYKNIKKSK